MRQDWSGHSGQQLDRVDDFTVIDCEVCGFKHVIPVPTPEDLEKVYQHDYYTQEKPLYLQRHQEDLEWWNIVYDERLETMKYLLNNSGNSLLEIGSGPGYFLLRAKEKAWQVTGVEPSRQAAEHTRSLGIEVINDFFTPDLASSLGTFDAIHMSEVLEHVPDPAELLKTAYQMLNTDGVICVAVPNDYSPTQHALRTTCDFQPWWVAPPHHINYFDPPSLARLLERIGFQVEVQEATFPIDLFLLMGENYIGNDQLGRQCHGRRKLLEINLEKAGLRDTKRKLYRMMAELGLGREIVVFARKKSD